MDTMHLGGAARQVVYVDASAADGGDGLTPATALNALPLPSDWTENTVYYLRRGQPALTVGAGSTKYNLSTQDGVYVLGAPPPGSHLHSDRPEAAAAWDDDEGRYALLQPPGAVEVKFTMVHAGVAHIEHRVPAAGVTDNTYNTAFWRFDSPAANRNVAWFFNHNLFSAEDVDFADDEFVTVWDKGVLHLCWMYHGDTSVRTWAGTAEMIGNTINLSLKPAYQMGMGGSAYGLRIENLGRAYVRGNRFHLGTCTSYMGPSGSGDCALYVKSREAEVSDNVGRLVVQQTGNAYPQMAGMFVNAWKIRAEDNDWRVHRYYGDLTNTYGSCGALISIQQSTHCETPAWFKVKNLYAHAGKFQNISGGQISSNYGYGVIMLAANGRNRADSYVKDITALVDRTGWGTPAGAAFNMSGVDCIPTPITGIVAKHYRSFGLGGVHYNSADSPFSFYSRNNYISGYMEVDALEGRIGVGYLGHLHVKDMKVPTPNPAALLYESSAHIDNLEFDVASWVDQRAVRGYRCQVVVERCNVPFLWDWLSLGGSTSTSDRAWFIGCNSDGGYEGRWVGSSGYFEGRAWNATREGGAPAALKLSGSWLDVRMPVAVGLEGFRSLTAQPTVAGRHTLTMYTAHKLFGDPALLPSRFRVFVRVPVGADDWREYCSQIHGAWLEDDSVWHEGDNSDTLTVRRWELPLYIDEDALAAGRGVDIRAEYDAYDPQGYLYFDPLPVLTASAGGVITPFSIEASPLAMRLVAPAITASSETEVAGETADAAMFFVTSRDRYHTADCIYAKTGVALTREQLLRREAVPCSHCNPPALA